MFPQEDDPGNLKTARSVSPGGGAIALDACCRGTVAGKDGIKIFVKKRKTGDKIFKTMV